MMASQPALASSDGSSNINTSERCPRSLFSRDSAQEHHKILKCYQYKRLKRIKMEVKREAKETSLNGDVSCKEEDVRPEISTDPENTRAILRTFKTEEEEDGNVKVIKEEGPLGISTNPRGTQRNIKAELEKERRMKAKMKILEIGMDGRYRWYNTDKYPDSDIVDDDITAYVAKEKAMTPNLQPVRYKDEKPYSCPDCGKRFTHEKYLIIHYRSHSGEKPFICAECGKSFPYRSSLDKHKITHSAVGAFPCPECGKRFRAGWILASHQKVHLNDNVHRSLCD